MARGYDQFYGRAADVAGLGRALSRRARAHCELCGASGSLQVVEIQPAFDEPDPDRALMACERCREAVSSTRGHLPSNELRFLSDVVWSELLPVQLAAVRLLQRLQDDGHAWAREVLEGLYLDPEVEALL